MVASEASVGNAAAAKSASMAAKGVMCVMCLDKSNFHAPFGVGMAAGSVKAQGFVSMASASINQRASCAKLLLLRVSRKTAQGNGPRNPSASSNNGGILIAIFFCLGNELLVHESKRSTGTEVNLGIRVE
jgi:hypothetical protein